MKITSATPLLDQEARIQEALKEIFHPEHPNLYQLHKKWRVPYSTLWDRCHGRKTRVLGHESQMLIPLYLKNILVDRIAQYAELGFPPYIDTIYNAVKSCAVSDRRRTRSMISAIGTVIRRDPDTCIVCRRRGSMLQMLKILAGFLTFTHPRLTNIV